MMKSKKFFIMALSIAIISVISNGSVFAAPAEKYKVVDKSGGKKAKDPAWFSAWLKTHSRTKVEKSDKDFEGKEAFVIEQEGEDLDFLKMWANNINSSSEVVRYLSQEVENFVVGSELASQSGKQQEVERATKSLTTSLSKARLVGLRKEGDWWIKRQYTSGPNKGQFTYSYYVLYLIDKKKIDDLLEIEMKKAKGEATTETQEVVDQVFDEYLSSRNEE